MDVDLDQSAHQSELEILEESAPVPSVSLELAVVDESSNRKRARKRKSESARDLMNQAFRLAFPATDKSWASEIDSDSADEQREEEVKRTKAEKAKAKRASKKTVKGAAKPSVEGAETSGGVQNNTITTVKASGNKVCCSFLAHREY